MRNRFSALDNTKGTPDHTAKPTGEGISVERALVLGGGGTTGIAWEVGVLDALAAQGVEPGASEVILGTSAGAIVGTHLALGDTPERMATHLMPLLQTIGRVDLRALRHLLDGQRTRDRDARAELARRKAQLTRVSSGLTEGEFVRAVAAELMGVPWPPQLRLTAVNGRTGQSVVWDAASGVDLGRAVAASCAVPAVFPPVMIDGDPYLDGGVRSNTNVDRVAGASRVLVLAPVWRARDPWRRPGVQLSSLPPTTRWLMIRPDLTAQRAIGLDPLDAARAVRAREAGYRQGVDAADAARRVWGPQPARAARPSSPSPARVGAADRRQR